jgi:uncharacterized membrane protein
MCSEATLLEEVPIFDVNLKAGLEIAHLHEKLDRLRSEGLSQLEKLQRSSQDSARPAH